MMLPALLSVLLSAGGAAGYVPPPADQVNNYFTAPISRAQLQGKGLRELAILRNTIYARYGWDGFRKQWLRDYFHGQAWFKPNPKFSYALISDVDRKNAHTIGAREASFTRADLEAMETAIFKRNRVTFGDKPVYKLPDGTTRVSCEGVPQGELVAGKEQSRDCAMAGLYKADPKSTLATLPADDRIELGLIQRAMGFFALDGDDHLADPDALDKQLTLAELRQLSGRDLRILRNTIYARRGRPFKSPVLREHFEQMGWYKADPAYTDARLTAVDKRNVALIKSVEEELGGPISDDEQTKQLTDPNFDGA